MRRASVYAVKRALSEGFVIVRDGELDALDALPGWMTRLFMAMLRCTDYGTGKGHTSYAALQARMTPIQPRSGPRHEVPTLQAIKRAVGLLEERQLICRDKTASIEERHLFFKVAPRYEKARPFRKLDPQTRPPAETRKPSIHAGSEATGQGTRPPNSTRSSTAILLHIKEGKLSTGLTDEARVYPQPPEADTPPGPIVVRGGEKIGPPRGADTRPAEAGHAPQRKPTRFAAEVHARQRGKIGPPKGAETSPDGHAPLAGASPFSSRVRKPQNTVLNGDSLEFSDGSPSSDARGDGSGGV